MSYSILYIVGFNSLSVRSRLDLKFLRGQCMGLFAEAGSVLSKKDDQAEQKWARHQKNITSGLEKPGPRVEVGEEMPQLHSGQTEESLIYWRIQVKDQCQKQAQNWQRRRTTPLFRDMLPVQVKPVAVKSCWHSMSQQVFYTNVWSPCCSKCTLYQKSRNVL